ncbi:MAG: alpha-glucosidase family protein [Ahrensia sp.]|nr:alpha-glucosidase family protein [Ahrensia sp.]
MTIATLQRPNGKRTIDLSDKDWWRGAVIYQIYPRSFMDLSGDGVGDLAGIAARMNYIASLGVDAIWISPFFPSPMKDFGYDVSDYTNVDPMFGTLHDFDQVIQEAHANGVRVMIDQVISHTSDQHAWFGESASSRDNDKADWYVWADAKPDGSPPNNWLSIFGGSAWQWHSGRCQYYLHNFLTSQPDLNFHNRDVQDALLDTVRFWLERGVDGFRLDTINFYFHDKQLRDNPALSEADRNDSIAPKVNPYNYQNHIHDKNQPENLKFLERLRTVMDEYPAIAAVGEVGDAQYGLKLISDYTSGDERMQMCYSFDFLSPELPTVERIANVLTKMQEAAPDGWLCWAFSNHDVMRHASRWGASVADQTNYLKLLSALLFSLRGSVCIYQGEELGLTEADIAFEDLQDPYGKQFWPEFKGRDGCRTPMVWDEREQNCGFSNAETWLPIPPEHRALAVSEQDHLPASLLNHYRQMLTFRAENLPLSKGDLEIVIATGPVLAFTRRHENQRIFCAFNMSEDEQTIDAPERLGEVLEGHGFACRMDEETITLEAWNAFYART